MKPRFPKPKDAKKRKVKTPTAKKMRQECDLLVKMRVHHRDGYACVASGELGVRCVLPILQAAHIFPKGRYPRLRWEEDNLLSMCYFHHIHGAHKDPLWFSEFVHRNWPERIERMQRLANTAEKINLKELLAELRQS